jgi:predicted nucleic acid-binding protein
VGVILDSSVVIDAERQGLTAAQFLRRIIQQLGEIEVGLCSITVSELAHGIYRANTRERREQARSRPPPG